MELRQLVHHDSTDRHQNAGKPGERRGFNPAQATQQHPTSYYSPSSASDGNRARTTSASSITSSIPNSSPTRTKISPITLPSIHDLVQTAEEMQGAPPRRYQEISNPPAAYPPQITGSETYPTPEQQNSIQRRLDIPVDSSASMRKHRIPPSDENAALPTTRVPQVAPHQSPRSPRARATSDGSYARMTMDQTIHTSSTVPLLASHRQIPTEATHTSSNLSTASRNPRSNSLDSSGSSSAYPSGSATNVADSVHSPDLEHGGGNLQWQHHHYIAPPATGTYGNQLTDRYTCATCNKPFSRPSSLRIHSHSHTGEKPFRCPHPDCGKAFSVRSNMKRHERGCHGGNQAGIRKT